MSIEQKSLNDAVVIYLAYGKALSPRQNRQEVIEIFGQEGSGVVHAVEDILKEAVDLPVDWTKNDLVSAGKLVRAVMHERHPSLSNEALDAIEWKFTFDWR